MENQNTDQSGLVLSLQNENAELKRRLQRVSRDLDESRAAHRGTQDEHGKTLASARALLAKMKAVHESEDYKDLFELAEEHNFPYSGDNYEAELKALAKLIDDHASEKSA